MRHPVIAALSLGMLGLVPHTDAGAAQVANLHITGSATANAPPALDDDAFDVTTDNGRLEDRAFAQAVPPGESAAAESSVSAHAAFGALGVQAISVAVGPPNAEALIRGEKVRAAAIASASWTDVVSIVPDDTRLQFTTGRFRFRLGLEGAMIVSTDVNPASGGASTEYSAGVCVSFGTCPFGSSQLFTLEGTNATQALPSGAPLPGLIEGEATVSLGSPFTLFVELNAFAATSLSTEGIATADSDLMHTLVWNGIQSVSDASGNPIAFHVESLSGTDWSAAYVAPVPLPAAGLQFLCAMGALLGSHWRRSAMRAALRRTPSRSRGN